MLKKIILINCFIFTVINLAFSQEKQIKGKVSGEIICTEHHEENEKHKQEIELLTGVNVYILGSNKGTVTDESGEFIMKIQEDEENYLIFSFIGYKSDTVKINKNQKFIKVILKQGKTISEVVVKGEQSEDNIAKMQTIQTKSLDQEDFKKMACCNLSESFENSLDVDVEYSDAITGAKHIKILGLSGFYTQISTEKTPDLRGLSSSFGLGLIPGAWMEAIQISKGSSSVQSGYESMTGEINIELLKPQKANPLTISLFSDDMNRREGDIIYSKKLNNNLSTMLFLHGTIKNTVSDNNNDGFIDVPANKMYNIFNRWNWENNRTHIQFGFRVIDDEKKGGQIKGFNEPFNNDSIYRTKFNIKNYKAFLKAGTFLKNTENSIALITSASKHEQYGFIGLNNYNGLQNNIYSNLLYNYSFSEKRVILISGVSVNYDEFNETLNDTILNKEELVYGIFEELTYKPNSIISIIAGVRLDENSIYGTIFTPRIHAKFDFIRNISLRINIGKGSRSANIISENINLLSSSRKLLFKENLKLEESINYGVGLTKTYYLKNNNKITTTLDFFRTEFQNQIIVDVEQLKGFAYIYNLKGKSFSNNMQCEIKTEISRLEIITAFRYNDVKKTYENIVKEEPLSAKYKGLLALTYKTKNKKFDFNITCQYNGKSRLPDISNGSVLNNVEQPKYSEEYILIHSQINYRVKKFEFYLGSENLTDYIQKNPIISAEKPFSNNFDSSFIWGPITGRMFYLGLRFKL